MEKGYLHSLVSLTEFKAILGIDDREDALCRFVLITSSYSIEQYCHRRLLRKKCLEYLDFAGEHSFSLRDYPVRRIISVEQTRLGLADPTPLASGSYRCVPECGIAEDIPFSLVVSPEIKLSWRKWMLKTRYVAGYAPDEVPADLKAAAMELAAWNLGRHRGRGNDGREPSMPENVRGLLEPYKRRMI
jgi:uncharacterized phiE125 gp8 family phage protein